MNLVRYSIPDTFKSIGETALTYLEISTVYMCEIGFNSDDLCTSSCLSSEFVEFENLDTLLGTSVIAGQNNTNREFFLSGHLANWSHGLV